LKQAPRKKGGTFAQEVLDRGIQSAGGTETIPEEGRQDRLTKKKG